MLSNNSLWSYEYVCTGLAWNKKQRLMEPGCIADKWLIGKRTHYSQNKNRGSIPISGAGGCTVCVLNGLDSWLRVS